MCDDGPVWRCDGCGTDYTSRAAAERCEIIDNQAWD